MRGHPINLIGERFDKLIVVALIEGSSSGRLWLCRCDCGQEIIKLTTQLRRLHLGNRIGCKRCERQSRSDSMTQHGGCKYGKSRLYNIWKGMRKRCRNPKIHIWKWYGGKGVTVHHAWESFENFRAWALERGYQDHLSIDRIDSSGNYEPRNCQWITRSENSKKAAKVVA